jgi:Holliday junction resolvase-like predicted endonuclease
MRESQIQHQIIKWLESQGWLVVKIIQTNKNGWPDLQLHAFGVTIFIEVKSENGKLSELQKYRHKQLQDKGFFVITSSSLNHLQNEFIKISEGLRVNRVIGNLN